MAAFPHASTPTASSYLGPHFLNYTTSVEKMLLPHVKVTETILGTSNRLNGFCPRVSIDHLSNEENSSPLEQQGKKENKTETNGASPGPIADASSDNSEGEEAVDVVKSAFRQVKSNSRSHPYIEKNSGPVRTFRKSSPTLKSVGDSKKPETVVISDGSPTPATTPPQKTVWRPY